MFERRTSTSRGLSLIELIVVMVMTGVIFGVTQLLLVRTIDTWWRVNANQGRFLSGWE